MQFTKTSIVLHGRQLWVFFTCSRVWGNRGSDFDKSSWHACSI